MRTTTASDILETQDNNGCTPLIVACCDGKLEAVKGLVAQGANLFAMNKEGWTALGFACANDHLPVVQYLVAFNRSCLDFPDRDGRTPLHRAVNYGRSIVAQYLLSEGANIEHRDDKSKTPLHAAVSRYCNNSDVVELLIKHNAQLEAITEIRWTPLHSACRYSCPAVVKTLVRLGARLEARNHYGETPLNMVVSEDRMNKDERYFMASTLLMLDADVLTQDNVGRTPLHWACIRGDYEVASLLLDEGAKVDSQDNEGKKPIHYVKNERLIQLILEQNEITPTDTLRTSFSQMRFSEKPTTLSRGDDTNELTSPAFHQEKDTLTREEVNQLLQDKQQQIDQLTAVANNHRNVIVSLVNEVNELKEQMQLLKEMLMVREGVTQNNQRKVSLTTDNENATEKQENPSFSQRIF